MRSGYPRVQVDGRQQRYRQLRSLTASCGVSQIEATNSFYSISIVPPRCPTLLIDDPGPLTEQLMTDDNLPFAVRLITNTDHESLDVVSQLKPSFTADVAETTALDLSWPAGVVSLSHVALSVPPDDPLYGRHPPEDSATLFLGQIDVLGERGILRISSDWLLRIRYNPLFAVVEQRMLEWVEEFSDTAN